MEIAKNKEMDVVEVSPNTTPPVCRIMDYGKYIFEQKKKTQGSKKKQKIIHVKEIKFRPVIEDGDYNIKLGKIINFLEQGDQVTSAMKIGGFFMCVMVGWGPTTSEAISRASWRPDAGWKPMRRTAAGSPPTMITRPRCSRACVPQYHM